MKSQIDMQTNQNDSEHIVPETSHNKMKTWIYRIACILLVAAGIVFFVCLFRAPCETGALNYIVIIVISALAAISTAVWCFIRTLKKMSAIKIVTLIITGIVIAANWFIYFRYVPKYDVPSACAIVKADPKYTSSSIEPHYVNPACIELLYYELKDNPFWNLGYLLEVVSDGKVTAWIAFDSATGKYELFDEYQPED